MINKDFEKVTYPNAFQSFEFVDTGKDKPYNECYGTHLVTTKSTVKELIPILGLRAPIKITQTRAPGNTTVISFVGKYSETNEYGVIFAIQDQRYGKDPECYLRRRFGCFLRRSNKTVGNIGPQRKQTVK